MEEISIGAIILAVTQLSKMTFTINKRYIPIIVLGISSVMFSVFAYLNHTPITWEFISTALVTAFTAMGIWSGVKTSIK